MMTLTIFHNPRCSKSREALSIVQQFAHCNNMAVDVVEYLTTPPSVAQLASLHRQLGGELRDMVRTNEEEYAKLCLENADDETLLNAVSAHPILLQRPIVLYGERAVIGRPPERLNEILRAD